MMTKRKFLLPSSWRSLRNPITGAPSARKLKLFSNMARRATLARPTKSTRAGSCATTDDRAQFSQPPPLLWLAPQSDHGSAACAETEAFLIWPAAILFRAKLARPTKSTRAGSWRNDDDKAQISKPPLLWLAPQSDHGSAARAETEAFFQYGPPQPFFQLSWLALQKARREGVPRARKLKLFCNMARRNPFSS